jgi:YfiH family protein
MVHFGDKTSFVAPHSLKNKLNTLNNQPLIFQHQIHSNKGLALTEQNIEQYKHCLTHNSDYLITAIKNIWIGALTADCLPIALMDEKHNAIGIVHAGWRGTIGKIAVNTLNHMRKLYGTKPEEVKISLGPCALPCCYEIDQPFIDNLPEWAKQSVYNNTFDLPACNIHQLIESGVKKEYINRSHNQCTICNDNFCSHRKNPMSRARQMSIISLR